MFPIHDLYSYNFSSSSIMGLTSQQIVVIVIIVLVLVAIGAWLFSKRTTKVIFVTSKPAASPPVTEKFSGNPASREGKQGNNKLMYYFHNPRCHHCQRFNPVWDSIAQMDIPFGMRSVNTASQDQAEAELSSYYQIKGTPTLILSTPDGDYEYSGDRSAQSIIDFANQK